MGIFKAFTSSVSGTLADQWLEYFACDAIPADLLMVRGAKRAGQNSANTNAPGSMISDGSLVVVADGEAAIAVSGGEVISVWKEPGEHVFRSGESGGIFGGTPSGMLKDVGRRFAFGGDAAPVYQQIFYFNTKEIPGNAFSAPAPIPFRIRDDNVGLDVDCSISCAGMYSFRITRPEITYKRLIGNAGKGYTKDALLGQMESEMLTILQAAAASLNTRGIRLSSIPSLAPAFADAVRDEFNKVQEDLRGISLVSVAFSELTVSDADRRMIFELQRDKVLTDPTMAAAHLVGAQADAMQAAAANTGGAPSGGSQPGGGPRAVPHHSASSRAGR